MRIVAHNGANIWGGAERATVALLAGLAGRGHDVTLLCNSSLVMTEATRLGVAARLRPIGGDISIHHAVLLARSLRRLAPDVFIVGTYRKLLHATLGARLAHVPRVLARIGLETDTPRSAKYRYALRHWTDGVAVNAARMVQPFADLEGFGSAKVRLIHNGVRRAENPRRDGAVRNELGIPGDAFVIGTVARLAKQKRLDRLLAAMTDLPPDIHCLIAGDGEERDTLERLVTDLGVRDRVTFAGERGDTGDIMEALDVFVITSDREGLSNAMLEAMSHGVPVVSTPVSGADDALAPGDDASRPGIITDFPATSIAMAVLSLHQNAELRKQMAVEGRRRAAEDFSMDGMLDSWEDFLTQR